MKNKFKMFPFNSTGTPVTVLGHKINGKKYGLECDLYYTVIEDVRILVDEITGMVIWGEFNDGDIDIDAYFDIVLKNKKVIEEIKFAKSTYLNNGILLPEYKEKAEIVFKKQIIINKKDKLDYNVLESMLMSGHFQYIFYSKDFGHQTTTSNSIIINPMNYIIPKGIKEETVTLDDIIPIEEIPHVNCLILMPFNKRGTAYKVISFKISGYTFAYYIPDTNTLLISDFLYSEEKEWAKKFFLYIKKYLKTLSVEKSKKEFEITIGCDPEFELYNKKNKLMVGNDLNADGRLQRKIGADGHGRQLELRPDPSTNVDDIIEELSGMFAALSHLRINVKGNNEPLGGHIHFGIISEKFIGEIVFNKTITDLLDLFIGKHTAPMNGEARGGYGKMGDCRNQPWGFEYRVAPAGIFATKRMAHITLTLAQKLIETIINEDIKSKLVLNKETLMRFLPEEDAQYYLDFPTIIYPTLDTENIGQYWTDQKNEALEIVFYDKWNESVKEKYLSFLEDTIVDGKTKICFYGLKGDMACSGLKVLGADKPHPRGVHCNEGIAIGLPKKCRMEGTYMKEIVAAVKAKIGSINGTSIVERTTANLFPEELIGSKFTEADLDKEGF